MSGAIASPPEFATAGRIESTFPVLISNRIIQLFSEGLYASPNKAVEELVSNSFDAGAANVHVVLSPNLHDPYATIAVIDDGSGLSKSGFRDHWLIGVSRKRASGYSAPKGRRQIGKFGIGKLATYVLAERLTHISKTSDGYLSASMYYPSVPIGSGEVAATEPVLLELRMLTEAEARAALDQWLSGNGEAYQALKLFGEGAAKTWTVAVMSDLKPLAKELQRGRLKWVLQTAMPIRDDFKLFLDGHPIEPAKLKIEKYGSWILGETLLEIPSPADDEYEPSVNEAAPDIHRFGLSHPILGRVSGYVELYKDPLDGGKPEQFERSHGFFIYVHGRLVNVDDAGFGIDRNKLRHGTFSRTRIVLYVDTLDDELRSSRETVREGTIYNAARNLAHGLFNFARTKHERQEQEESPDARLSRRLEDTPRALTRRPLVSLVQAILDGDYHGTYVRIPHNLRPDQQKELIAVLEGEGDSPRRLIQDLCLSEIGHAEPLAILEPYAARLTINTLHPFVAHFLSEYENKRLNLPLELLALGEVIQEAHFVQAGLEPAAVHDLLRHRDLLLRHLARAGRKNAILVAQELESAATDKYLLEKALVAAFHSMGFDAVPLGGPDKPDGIAAADIPARQGQGARSYTVSLEAKSKQRIGAKAQNKDIRVSTLARHRDRDERPCDHAVVVAPDFAGDDNDEAAMVTEIRKDNEQTGKTITPIRIRDLARLVRLVPLKRVGLDRLRELFQTCLAPDAAGEWIDRLEKEERPQPYYREILEQIYNEIKESPNDVVSFGALRVSLRIHRGINLTDQELMEECRALAQIVTGWVEVFENSVAISQRPDKIIARLTETLQRVPESQHSALDFLLDG